MHRRTFKFSVAGVSSKLYHFYSFFESVFLTALQHKPCSFPNLPPITMRHTSITMWCTDWDIYCLESGKILNAFNLFYSRADTQNLLADANNEILRRSDGVFKLEENCGTHRRWRGSFMMPLRFVTWSSQVCTVWRYCQQSYWSALRLLRTRVRTIVVWNV